MIEHEVWINAPRAVVFEAITTREGLDRWWGTAVAAECRVGAVVRFDHGFGEPLEMRVTELERDRLLRWRCISEHTEARNPASEWLGHELSFQLATAEGEPAFSWLGPRLGYPQDPAEVTVLHFRHLGWHDRSRWRAFCNLAWGATLAGLGEYSENGSARG